MEEVANPDRTKVEAFKKVTDAIDTRILEHLQPLVERIQELERVVEILEDDYLKSN